jgi:hypothetical protein
MNIKPLQNINEHDVINFFALDYASGNAGAAVQIRNGFKNGTVKSIYGNTSPVPNTYSPRWQTDARVEFCATGNKPFGILMNNVREVNQFGYPLIYDPIRKCEMQACVSGETVPILRHGLILVSGTGISSVASLTNLGAIPSPQENGEWLATTDLTLDQCFGRFLGNADAEGYALFSVECD